ncbi:MAG: trimethylamine methyltransferase family protein, partial [Pseudomonadota bacterium]
MSDAAPSGRRGRSARRERRQAGPVGQAVPYISRKLPIYDVLSEEGVLKIEANADRILAEIGLEFREDPEVLQIWKDAGADVDGERVRFPKDMLREILKTAPSQFTQHARNPARNVEIGGNNLVFAPVYGPPFVTDLDQGRRYGTIEDFRNFVKLAYMSPWMHHSGGTVCEPVDLPVNKRHFDMVYSHIKYSDKPFMGSVTAPERAEDSVKMAQITFGEEFVDQNCVMIQLINA